jgi:hypothetical protein
MAVGADVLSALASAIDRVRAADRASFADAEAIVALHAQLERLEAVVTRATAAFDAGGSWAADGARSGAAWVATRCRLPVATARRRVKLGRELRHMPTVEQAWLAGEIGAAQVTRLAEVRTPATSGCFERDETLLVDHARTLRYRHFVRALAYWEQLADPDGVEDGAEAQHQARRLHLSTTFAGTWVLDGVLDPISGTIVAEALGRIEQELFERDWAEARSRVGEKVCGADLGRTAGQRRADALVEMARRAGAVAPGARLPEPLFSIVVGYETFAGRICELAGASSPGPPAGRSRSATGSASTSTATTPATDARSTTSSPGPPAG